MEAAQPAYQENYCLVRENTFQAAYRDALQRAAEQLRSRDISVCCAGAGAALTHRSDGGDTIELPFLNRPVRITLPDLCFSTNREDETVSIWEQILVLHYLSNSQHAALDNTLINYRRLRDGSVYYDAFERRCTRPLLSAFGSEPDKLYGAAAALGGEPADHADCSVRIPAFPRIDIFCCLWRADAEFDSEATILFDSGTEQFLCAEDIAVLCQQIVIQLIKNRVS